MFFWFFYYLFDAETCLLNKYVKYVWIHYKIIKHTCGASLLSGCACPNPPVWLQSPELRCVVGPIFAPEPDQNHPLTLAGTKSGRSHPLKLHFLPDVQMYLMFPLNSI